MVDRHMGDDRARAVGLHDHDRFGCRRCCEAADAVDVDAFGAQFVEHDLADRICADGAQQRRPTSET